MVRFDDREPSGESGSWTLEYVGLESAEGKMTVRILFMTGSS